MERKPKIAVIGLKGLPAFGGAAAVGENIIEQLKDKYDFTVYSVSSHTDLKTGDYNGYRQLVFKKIGNKSYLNTLLYYFKAFIHVMFFGSYEIIHLHHNAVTFLIPFLRIRYKIVLTTHGIHTESKFYYLKLFYKIFDWMFFRWTNTVTTVSKIDYSIASRLKKKNVIYIPNGVKIPDMDFSLQKKIDGNYLLFAAGRIFYTKGCHLFLKAMINIDFSGQIIIVGDLSHDLQYSKSIYELAKKLDNVEFLGLIKDKNKLNELIAEAKLFVYPSFVESMSMMMLEVASLKTPMICSDITANKDLFNNNEVVFVKANDVNDLKVKINWALDNEVLLKQKAESALLKIRKNHNWKLIGKEYDKVFELLV